MSEQKKIKSFVLDRSDYGMNVISPYLVKFCQEKKCEFLKGDDPIFSCKNPLCYLSSQYLNRYSDEGYDWKDMRFNVSEGCFCFETAPAFQQCPYKKSEFCQKVNKYFVEPSQ